MTIREIAELMNMRKNRVKLILREYIFDGYRVKSWEERRRIMLEARPKKITLEMAKFLMTTDTLK